MSSLIVGKENGSPIELYYEDHGAGQPVILIHGWPLSGRSFEKQVAALVEAGYRAITYDRRGFGNSSQPWEGYDYDTLAADLRTLLDYLNLSGAAILGFSMGGGEVARYLGTYGDDRVTRAVFAAAVPPYLHLTADNPDGGLDDAAVAAFAAGVRGDRVAYVDAFATLFFSAGGRTDLVSEPYRRNTAAIAAGASPKGTLDCTQAFSLTDFRGDLSKISIPTLVIHGDSDAVVPFEVSGRRTHAAIAGSTLVLIEGAPHGLNYTHAGQFNQALLSFLAA
jgi:non-heme chloroperoxidase